MASTEDIVQRLKESKPPATDAATYLTIVEMSLTSEALPAFEELLDDVELTSEIGWDLIETLIRLPGSEGCLDRVARLGNPREVILKVLETMEKISSEDENEHCDGDENAEAAQKFSILCGMLGTLHKRLQVKAPSRFLQTTLDTVYRSYSATSAVATRSIVSLIRSLSGQKRPPLPTRTSSMQIGSSAATKAENAPDPEAEKADKPNSNEPEIMDRMLMCFTTLVIEAYVNSNAMEWAARLQEYTYPEKIVTGRPTIMQLFRDTEELKDRDGLIGDLVSLAGDLGISKLQPSEVASLLGGSINKGPLLEELESGRPEDVKLSTGGYICIVAYWIFSSELFDARHQVPDIYIFPSHHEILRQYLGEDAQEQIATNLGTVEAITVIGTWLQDRDRVQDKAEGKAETTTDFMSYHHLLTLISVFHPNIRVRNAATVLAGAVLHRAPEDDRLAILEDLIENCMFSSLQACAVSWFKDEIVAAKKSTDSTSKFSTSECLDTLQYTIYPDLTSMKDDNIEALLEFWAESAPLHLQAANFALFLFSGEGYRDLAPTGMAATIEHRYVEPLLAAVSTLLEAFEKKDAAVDGHTEALMQLGILKDTLARVPLQ